MSDFISSLTTVQKLVILALLWVVLVGKGTGGGGKPPFVTDKLSVLVIEESSDRVKYTADQLNVIQATDPRSLKVFVESKGGRFFVLDKDSANALANSDAWVKAAFTAISAKPPPWIAGATPKSGFSIPLVTEAEALKKAGGL